MKKLLALVLALVMTLSLCVTSNAAYADAADIDYTEAVDVMTAIGVLQGSDGKFNPDGILTRAEACTIITKLLGMGSYVGKSNFADCQGHWGEGAIALCAGEGIVDGVGGGNFNPNGKLTGYAFAKMLLVALGYDAKIEGMTGSDWTIKVAKLIKSNDLDDGVKGFVGSAEVSREVAAQMALNALDAAEVTYSQSQSVTNKGEVTTSTSLQATYVLQAPGNALLLREDYFPLLKGTPTNDSWGRPATNWAFSGKNIGTYADTADYTYVGEVTKADLYNTLGKIVCTNKTGGTPEGYAWTSYTNAGAVTDATATIPAKNDTAAFGSSATGWTTEIFVDDDAQEVTVVYTHAQIAKIVGINPNTVTLNYSNDNGANVNQPLLVDKDSDFYADLAAKAVKDYVAIVLNGTTLEDVKDVTKVVGTASKYVAKTGVYTVNGTEYANLNANTAVPVVGTTSYDLYVDENNVILYATATTKAADTFMYVLNTAKDGTAKTGYTYNVKGLLADGSAKWYEVTKYTDTAATAYVEDAIEAKVTTTNAAAGKFFKYTVSGDGMVELTEVAAEAVYSATGTFQGTAANRSAGNKNFITKNNVYRTAASNTATTDLTTTSATVFAVKDSNGNYKTYTGYRTVPDTNVTAANVLYKDGVVKMIVATACTPAASTDYVLFLDITKYTTGIADDGKTAVRTYDAFVNGKLTTIDVANTVGDPAAATFYDAVVYASEGYVTSLGAALTNTTYTASEVVKDTATTLALVDGVLKVDGATVANVAADFVAYTYDYITGHAAKNTIFDLTLGSTATSQFDDGGDYIVVITDSNGEATTLIAVDAAE